MKSHLTTYNENLRCFENKERFGQFCVLQASKNDLDSLLSNMEPIGCSERSVRNYHYSLRNGPEERSSLLILGDVALILGISLWWVGTCINTYTGVATFSLWLRTLWDTRFTNVVSAPFATVIGCSWQMSSCYPLERVFQPGLRSPSSPLPILSHHINVACAHLHWSLLASWPPHLHLRLWVTATISFLLVHILIWALVLSLHKQYT